MSLTRVFAATTALLVALVSVLLFRIVYIEWGVVHSASDGLEAMQVAYKAMVVAEKASYERGPTNGVMGEVRPNPKTQARLRKARATTDGAIADLKQAIALHPDRVENQQAAAALARAISMLALARADVDRIAALPRQARSANRVMGAVHEMFDVVPVAMEAVTALSRRAEYEYPQFSDMLIAARLAAELREYAGRLGSQFTGALATRAPLAEREKHAAYFLRGRVEELRSLIALRVAQPGTDQRIIAAHEEMQDAYFRDALAFVASVERASDERKPYGLTTEQFALRYQPPMGSIVHLRDVLVTVATEGAAAARESSRASLAWVSAMGVMTLIVVALIFLVIRSRVVAPLLKTTGIIVDIARGELDTPVPKAERRDEIGNMLEAVATLKANSVEKQRLELERQHLIDELKSLSSTDYLTGILNRRAFMDAAQPQLPNARRHGWSLALVMFDVDRFKLINDTYGHDAGDLVLIQVAGIAKRAFRTGDILARYGGEEFVALAVECDAASAGVLAERVREAIADTEIELSDGRAIRVTASFGVVVAAGPGIEGFHTLLHLADQALYAAKDAGRNRVVMLQHDALHQPG